MSKFGFICPECGHWQETQREQECVADGEAYVPAADYPEPSEEQLERMYGIDARVARASAYAEGQAWARRVKTFRGAP